MLQNLGLNSPFVQQGVTRSHFCLPLTCPLKTEALQRSWTGSERPDVAKCSQGCCWSTCCMDCHGLVHGAGHCDSLLENRQFPDKLIRVNTPTHRWSPPSYSHKSRQHAKLRKSPPQCCRQGLWYVETAGSRAHPPNVFLPSLLSGRVFTSHL